MKKYLLVVLLLTIFCRVTSDCDTSNPAIDEGNLGQAATFPWLGVLRVYLLSDLGDKPEIAVTGLVLIKKTHALVSADDVARIPQTTFQENTHAMFFSAPDTPWYCRPRSYKVHDEYEYKTINTIAVLELDLRNEMHLPLKPICWSHRMSFHTSLYLTGLTDENDVLEKVVHKIQYADKEFCDDFYVKSELTETKRTPTHYVCGFTKSKYKCVWENGMVLVSNASKHFSLVGFAIRGPGCAAPARFIDLRRYYKWVQEAAVVTPVIREGFRRDEATTENKILEEMLDFHKFVEHDAPPPMPMEPELYGFDTERPKYFNVDKLDESAILVFPFNGSTEAYDHACTAWKVLIYREYFELKSHTGAQGIAYYKISLYDLLRRACGCVRVSIESLWQSAARLSYKEYFEISEGTAMTSSEETPEELLKYFPMEERSTSTITPQTKWKPSPHLWPEYLTDTRRRIRVLHYDLYVRFGFYNQAVLKIEMYADNLPHTTTTTMLPRRMFDSPGLNPAEARLEYQRQMRQKMTRPPSRKMWYDGAPKNRSTRSGFVKTVPEPVLKSFENGSKSLKDIYNIEVNKIASPESIATTPNKNSYLKFIKNTVKPRAGRPKPSLPKSKLRYKPKTTTNIPDFIVNAIRSLSSAPKFVDSVNISTNKPFTSSAIALRLTLDKVIGLSILILLFAL